LKLTTYLGIDHGEARIGVAATDALGMMAHPVETIHVLKVADPIGRIAEIAAERRIDKIVVGMPFRLDGSVGTAAEKVQKFIAKLQERLPEMEIIPADERLTTVSAQAKLHEAGRNIKNSRSVIDQAAAVTILQDYLDALAGPESMLLPEEP
jgi:putative Holliday junction resolvase